MPKYYKKKYYRSGSRDKYSVEQDAGTAATNADGNGGVNVVPPTTLQGMRKVKHLTISMAHQPVSPSVQYDHLWWAIVYVPAGTTPNTISVDQGAMYEPNQFVMSCGIFDFDAGPLRVHCPISRNLNSGDSIALVIRGAANAVFRYVVRYAVTLQ